MKSKSVLDPTFSYTSAANTDIRKTFARLRGDTPVQTQPDNLVMLLTTALSDLLNHRDGAEVRAHAALAIVHAARTRETV